jgi:hypothetical protein
MIESDFEIGKCLKQGVKCIMNSGKLDNELGVLLQREEAKYSEN